MFKISSQKPIGEILQEAGLIYDSQLQVALQDQIIYPDLRLGEILALRGWIKQETVDFFAEEWSNLIIQTPRQPLGYYLKRAALLDETQIQIILQEQEDIKFHFGALAVFKGWLPPTTLDFFLDNLSQYSQYFVEHFHQPYLGNTGRRKDDQYIIQYSTYSFDIN
jgi:hypothetical protein